eukprot:9256393-Prorocentrum_lima.AAC.1
MLVAREGEKGAAHSEVQARLELVKPALQQQLAAPKEMAAGSRGWPMGRFADKGIGLFTMPS